MDVKQIVDKMAAMMCAQRELEDSAVEYGKCLAGSCVGLTDAIARLDAARATMCDLILRG